MNPAVLRQLAVAITSDPAQQLTARVATVVSFNAFGVLVTLAGSDVRVSRLAGYSPAIGDRVLVLMLGQTAVCLGRILP